MLPEVDHALRSEVLAVFESQRMIRLAGLAGAANVVLALLAILLTVDWSDVGGWQPWPTRNDSTAEYVAWFVERSATGTAQMMASNFGVVLAAFFVLGLVRVLRLPAGSNLAIVMLGSALALLVITIVANSMLSAGLESARQQGPAAASLIRGFAEAAAYTFYPVMPVTGVLLFAAAAANHLTGSLPGWVTWTAVVAGVANLAGPFMLLAHTGWFAPFSIPSAIPYLLLYGWVSAVGTLMLVSPVGTEPRP